MPIFYMTVGLPGSGKSTYAKRLAETPGTKVHSSDSIRAELTGDENNQDINELVFKTLHRRVKDDLRAGFDVIYDATNIKWQKRKSFLSELFALKIPDLNTVCLFFVVPVETCIEMQASRDRQVPEAVIRRMHTNIDIPMYCEGWGDIHIIQSIDKDYYELMETLEELQHDNPHHTLTVGFHCHMTARNLLGIPTLPIVHVAALLHDIGKLYTKTFVNSKGEVTDVAHFYNHENVGAYESFFYTSKMSAADRLYIAKLIRWHMYPYAIQRSDNPEKTKRKFKNICSVEEREHIRALNIADRAAH